VLAVIVAVPFLALLAAVPVAWGWGLSWLDVVIGLVFYLVAGFGVTTDSTALHARLVQGGAWTADRVGTGRIARPGGRSGASGSQTTDATTRTPTARAIRTRRGGSGPTVVGLAKGLFFAHCGWLLRREPSNRARFAPDLLADRDIRRVDRFGLPLALVSLFGPGAPRWPADLVLAGRADGILLGEPGPRRAAAPHHVVDQLDLPCVRGTAVRHPGRRPRRELLATGGDLVR
jgi:stearoyl-CoA desaturase (delta-9 desaturase)